MFQMKPQRSTAILYLCGFCFIAAAAETAGIWLDVPFIKQEKEGCGAASIAMVMQYWQQQRAEHSNESSDPGKIQRALYSGKEHGIRASDMVRYFQQHGYRTFAFAGKWEDFQQHLQKGRPLIVALKPSGLQSTLHYVVVVGVDPEQNLVLVNDAAQRKLLKEERGEFEKQWSAVERWTLLALPR
jgi:ABC-type bacteriocin/lantibiotic exporter with double-glycine peptidase domain